MPNYGAIDRSQKQNCGRHWFLCLHIDGVVLTVADAKINTGKLLSTRQINQLYISVFRSAIHLRASVSHETDSRPSNTFYQYVTILSLALP